MKSIDEAALRRRLHEEIDLSEIGPAPVEAVFRRYRTIRARQWAAITSGAAVIAVAAGVLAVGGPGQPGVVTPGSSARPNPGSTLTASARGGVFASGTANGRRWRLAAVNLANPGYRCLPGVVVNGQNGDLLQPGILPGLGNVAFLAVNPGRPGIGFAFLRLRPGVSDLIASLGDGTRLRLRPVTVTVCGQRFRLAGFDYQYPRQGVTQIAARSAQGRPIGYTPLADYFSPASPYQDGTWINLQAATGNVASGEIGSGTIGGTSWRMQVTLGPDGECFASYVPAASYVGPASAGGGASASLCTPVGASPKGASLSPFPMPAGTQAWYGTVNARTAYLRAHLSNGRTTPLVPAVVGGRKYIALAVSEGVKLTRLILYDTHGHVLADLTSFPRGT